jgi:phenylalanyl-tRNA synthetase beta chain
MKTLHGNKNNKLPLDLFELSDVVLKDTNKEQGAKNQRRLCALHSNQNSSGFEVYIYIILYLIILAYI